MSIYTKITPLIVGAITLSACGNVSDPDKTQNGALLGASVGLLSGILTDDDDSGIIKRIAVGAGIGAMIGNELDKQEEELRKDFGDSDAVIKNTGSELIVLLPEAITFDTDSSVVRRDLHGLLVKLSDNLNAYPDTEIDIIGHTDNVGDAIYNQELSIRRSSSVMDILLRNGVNISRIKSYGRGEFEPIESNVTARGRAQNRRVEIVITPVSS